MKLTNFAITALCVPMILFTSCATIINGTRQNVCISSEPTNADVWVDQLYVGKSPVIVSLARNENHFVHLELEGYVPFELSIQRGVSGWFFGNILFGGFIGIAVDAISGGMYKLTPEQAQAHMRECKMANAKKTDQSYIAIVMNADPSWEKIGNLELAN